MVLFTAPINMGAPPLSREISVYTSHSINITGVFNRIVAECPFDAPIHIKNAIEAFSQPLCNVTIFHKSGYMP